MKARAQEASISEIGNWEEVVNSSPLPIIVCTLAGKNIFINPAFSRYFGYLSLADVPFISDLFIHEEVWKNISKTCEISGSWDGYAILLKNNGEEMILKANAGSVNKGILAIYFSETNEARRRVFMQGQLLKASSVCSSLLISLPSFVQGIYKVVEIIGKAVRADRCYVYHNTSSAENEGLYATLIAQWSRSGIPISKEEIQQLSYTEHPVFLEHFNERKYLSGIQSHFKGETRILLEQRRIRSLLCLPIYKDANLWGFMGFDDCETDREWDDQEVAALELLTNTIASVLNRQELREELVKKNEQLESAIRGSKDSLWDYDIQKGKFYYSPQFLELLGYNDNELTKTVEDLRLFVHPESFDTIFEQLPLFMESGGELKDFEIRLLNKEGQVKWIKISTSSTRDIAGNYLRISGSNTDFTLEKEYQLSIAESKEKYRELVDNLREVVFQLDKDKNIIFLNEAWHYLTGLPLAECLNKKFDTFLHPADIKRFDGIFYNLVQHKNAYLNCLVRIKKDPDEEIWAEIYARSNFRDEENPYILGTIIDVSQRYLTEQKLKESEEKYRLISDNISDMVSLQDIDQAFIYVSPSVKQILGYDVDEMLGKLPQEIFGTNSNNFIPWINTDYQEITEDRKIYSFVKRSGEEIWLETVSKPIVSVHGPLIIQTATRDITTHKIAELNLKTALEKQKELNQLKSDFISMASHEFRTPLTTIRSSVQLLQEYSADMPENQKMKIQRHHERIKNQIERVTHLMNDVLTLGKFDAGKTPFFPQEKSLETFLNGLISEHFFNLPDGRFIEKKVSGKPFLLSFDSSLMTHVFINVLSNAFKYSTGKKNPELLIHFEENKVVTTVKDYGIGIPENEKDKVFESFYRAKNAIVFPGTGLGLVITKEFVELHKGTIEIKSELDSFTEMIITLPKNN